MDILADLIYLQRLFAVLRRDRILFLFFKGGTTVIVVFIVGVVKAVKTVLIAGIGVVRATGLTDVAAKAATLTKGRFSRGVKVTVFSRIRLLRFT